MDSLAPSASTARTWSPSPSGWALSRGRDIYEIDAAVAAGIALKSLDDLIRADPPWIGCWRDRLALKSAASAAKMLGRNGEENAFRDALFLTSLSDDPGPAGRLFLAMRLLSCRSDTIGSAFVRELGGMLDLRWKEGLASIPDMIDSVMQSGRAAPFAVADLITAISAVRPDAEVLALGLADVVLSQKLNWPKPVPLLLPERFGPAFRTIGGRGSVRTGEPVYRKVIYLALVDGLEAALRSASETDRRVAAGHRAETAHQGRRSCHPKTVERRRRAGLGPAAPCRAGPPRGCSIGLKALRRCASFPVDPRSGSLGYGHGRIHRSQKQSASGEKATARGSLRS